ncbi:MAG: sigma-70 family RNA polymerase sigma factor [Planctomycetota bacterium]
MNDLAVPPPDEVAVLYREHGRALRAFVGSRVRDQGAVEDICHDTFVAALDKGVPDEGTGRWLFGIARNKVLKHHRDHKPPREVAERAAPAPGPAEALALDEAQREVRAAVADLDPDLREVIRLRYEGGLNYRQIADYLDLPFTTVQGRLKRARIALRHTLVPEEAS